MLPSQGASRTSRTNQSGPSSPAPGAPPPAAGRALVRTYEVIPDPLPKCLCPLRRYLACSPAPSPAPAHLPGHGPGARDIATAARLRRDRPPPGPPAGGPAGALALRLPGALERLGDAGRGQPEAEHGRVHRTDQRHRGVPPGQRPQQLAHRPGGARDVFPQPALLHRQRGPQVAGVPQAVEVRPLQAAPALALRPLPGPLRRDGLDPALDGGPVRAPIPAPVRGPYRVSLPTHQPALPT